MNPATVTGTPGDLETLLAGLHSLDGVLTDRVGRLRHRPQRDGLNAYYVADAEVDALLPARTDAGGTDAGSLPGPRPLLPAPDGARFARLAGAFGLSPLDLACLLICVAPEVDRRYERLYGYLQDDVTRRIPGLDLILDLTCPDLAARLAARARFSSAGPLLRHRLVRLRDHSGQQPAGSLLDHAVQLDPRIARFLLDPDGGSPDDALTGLISRSTPSPELVLELVPIPLSVPVPLPVPARVAAVHGSDLEGRAALAIQLAHAHGRPAVILDGDKLAAAADLGTNAASIVGLALREARLAGAVLAWTEADALPHGAALHALLATLLGPARQPGDQLGELELIVTSREPVAATLGDVPVLGVPVPRLTAAEREKCWRAELLATKMPVDPELGYQRMAGAFAFSGGRIAAAAATASWLARTRPAVAGPASATGPRIGDDDVLAACQQHAQTRLGPGAERIIALRGWDELVLPADRVEQLREFTAHVQHREQVHQTWGFGRLLGAGQGLNALFTGPPGTGKTMAAGVLAHALGRDLYRIDLSSLVSKYIGETEKNLARVFDEAADGNVVLFFDEADALFGKRTSVKDAHDRYANIETSYLLQRLESHPGVVILATNLRKNMDDAFTRRLHVTIEFPMPDEADRARIWAGLWPDAAPLSPGVDLAEMAARVDLPGGNLRNIALASAFLAAADGGVVTMAHLEHATRREYQKLGKILTTGDFAAG